MSTLSKLPVLTPGLCLYSILKFHCKPLVQWSVSCTEHGITSSKICHEIAPPYLIRTILTNSLTSRRDDVTGKV